jgi:hypothetical protein
VPEGNGHPLIEQISEQHAELDALVTQMMRHDPLARPSMAQVAAALADDRLDR